MSFCSRADLLSGTPAAGTGVRAEAYVFLPVPKRLWRAQEMNPGWASTEELAAIAAARRGGVVTRLYNPPKAQTPHDHAILLHAAPGRTAPGLQPLLDALAHRWKLEPNPAPRLAICTHGTRDRCCAKWGFAAYSAALKLFQAGGSPFEPIESSHLGGDRFAATGIFFPSGSMYAHLDSLDLAALTASEAAGRIEPAHYRGRVFEAPLAQVVRAGLAREGLLNDASAPLRLRRDPPDAPRVTVTAANGRRFEVDLAQVEVSFFASCDKLAEHKPAAGRRTVYAGARVLDAAG
ncbi:sucrase ferredoxin [Phenylobacterium sp.]|uniref:sucrase ferredoxin n=1 Tax=Phenylobacterium sp. TaxID=1871053 RepID=UPI0035B0BC40